MRHRRLMRRHRASSSAWRRCFTYRHCALHANGIFTWVMIFHSSLHGRNGRWPARLFDKWRSSYRLVTLYLLLCDNTFIVVGSGSAPMLLQDTKFRLIVGTLNRRRIQVSWRRRPSKKLAGDAPSVCRTATAIKPHVIITAQKKRSPDFAMGRAIRQ